MRYLKLCILAVAMVGASAHAAGPLDPSSELFSEIMSLDAQLFSQGFNHCDLPLMASLVADELEFFHDESGVSHGKQSFLDDMRQGVCENDYRALRKLDESSTSVFPLKRNGVLYGAVQRGRHTFLADTGDGAPFETSTADFILVWLLEGDRWQLARVLSYGHEPVERKP